MNEATMTYVAPNMKHDIAGCVHSLRGEVLQRRLYLHEAGEAVGRQEASPAWPAA